MKKAILLLAILSAMILTSCNKETSEVTDRFSIPSELEGAKIHRLQSDEGQILFVVTVPYKIVTARDNSKHPVSVTTIPERIEIDGKTYILTEEKKDE